ncbi:sulfatase-like hydrolase/transferase [Sphingobacterium sp. SGL-16]|nr:sulfatase-like hydrolase/transferase [Sphingobacterium sp. SGL-16]
MLLTGKHGGHSYIRGNYEMGGFTDETEGGQMPLPEGIYSIPKMLKSAGYKTGIIGKWGLGMHFTSGNPNLQGFDYAYGYLDQKQAHNYFPTHLWENGKWHTLNNTSFAVHRKLDSTTVTVADFEKFKGNEYAGTKFTDKALKFLEENQADPFFLYLPYTIPHVGLQVPDKYIQQYIGKFPGEKPYYGQSGYNTSQYPLSTYAGMISFLDEQVGILMQKVKELGLDENTIILFSSDNGATFNGGVQAKYFNSAADLRGLKMDVFEGGIRVPFIVRWPKMIKSGSTSDFISVQFDMMETFTDILGIETQKNDGISILPTLLNQLQNQKQREYIYFEYPEKGGQVAIRMGDWKGVRVNVRKDKNSPWMLFNLKDDRGETRDLAKLYPEIIEKFNAIQLKEHQNSHITEWEFLNNKSSTIK